MKYKWHEELRIRAKEMREDLRKNGFAGRKLTEKEIKKMTSLGECNSCGTPWVVIESESTQNYGVMKSGCEHQRNIRICIG